jgi:calmodulin
MADQLTEEQVTEFKEAFSLFDRDECGTIPVSMLGTVLRAIGQNPSESELTELINELNVGDSGLVDFPRFLNLMARRPTMPDFQEEFREICRCFDKDSTGLITVSELRQIILNLGEVISDEEITRDWVDGGSGRVNYEEFIRVMMSK